MKTVRDFLCHFLLGLMMIAFPSSALLAGSTARLAWHDRNKLYGNDEATGLAVDAEGNVFITGTYSGTSYATLKFDAGGDLEWEAWFNSSDDVPRDIALDGQGNVIVTGSSGARFGTVKYDPQGNELWRAFYGGTNGAYGGHLAIDDENCIYVSGQGILEDEQTEFAIVKYNPEGDQIGVIHYAPGGQNAAGPIIVDDAGYLYVTGPSNHDYVTIKYDPLGNQVWLSRYVPGWASPSALVIDDSGNVYVTGDGGTVKYDSDGMELWSGVSGRDLQVNQQGNVYVVSNYLITKYDADGNVIWALDEDFESYRIELNASGDAYIGGYNGDMVFQKRAPDGTLVWSTSFAGPSSLYSILNDFVVTERGQIYAAGTSRYENSGLDFTTLKYMQWVFGSVPVLQSR